MKKYFYTIKNFIILLGLMGVIGTEPIFSQEVEVIGDLKITNGSQGEGKVLVSDADGVARWETKTDLLIDLHKDLNGGLVRLIQWGISPVTLWEAGIPYDSLIGLNISKDIDQYNNIDQFIFYVDTLDIYPFEYIVTYSYDYTYGTWACPNTVIPGADGVLLGDGKQNNLDVLSTCSPQNSIFTQISNWDPNIYVASVDEAMLIYTTLITNGIDYDIYNHNQLWTSTEAQGANEATHAMIFDVNTGTASEHIKSHQIRGILIKYVY